MDYNEEKIGEKIKLIRNRQNLSQERFGKKLGLSSKTISAYEKGRINPPYKVLEKISEVYDVGILSASKNKRADLVNKVREVENIINDIKDFVGLKN